MDAHILLTYITLQVLSSYELVRGGLKACGINPMAAVGTIYSVGELEVCKIE